METKIEDQFTLVVSSAVMADENSMPKAMLTAIGNVVFPRVEMAVKSITISTGHGTYSEEHKPDRKDFLRSIIKTPFLSASSRLDLGTELNRNDMT